MLNFYPMTSVQMGWYHERFALAQKVVWMMILVVVVDDDVDDDVLEEGK